MLNPGVLFIYSSSYKINEDTISLYCTSMIFIGPSIDFLKKIPLLVLRKLALGSFKSGKANQMQVDWSALELMELLVVC